MLDYWSEWSLTTYTTVDQNPPTPPPPGWGRLVPLMCVWGWLGEVLHRKGHCLNQLFGWRSVSTFRMNTISGPNNAAGSLDMA